MTFNAFTQSPQKMSYQAVIRNTGNQLVTTQIGIQISILQGTESGKPVYVETQTPTPNANGLVTIEIGGGAVVIGIFEAIDWSRGPYFIKTETAIDAPLTTYTITGTSQLLSVPYALYAKTSEFSAESDGLRQQIKILEDNLIAGGTYKLADIDSNQYNVVKIGTQVWMKENLKTTKYNDGTVIPNVTDGSAWEALSTPGYCWYLNDAANNKATFGALYNWYAADVHRTGGKNICPTGWHVPTDAEWTTLTTYLGGESVAGGKLKETGTTHWMPPNIGATNEAGFSAIPVGPRTVPRGFNTTLNSSVWWSCSDFDTANALDRWIGYSAGYVAKEPKDKKTGYSVRCLRDK